jgi:eukaryotic-like serine/threonine-protein kinase
MSSPAASALPLKLSGIGRWGAAVLGSAAESRGLGVIDILKPRQKLGKYRIERRLGVGGFACVYQAMDTIEGIRVALKIPRPQHLTEEVLNDFRNEVRLTAKLDHPNILLIKDASFIDDCFVIVFQLGERTLADRLKNRLSFELALDYAQQMLEAVAYAHSMNIMHCDIKPENFIIFPNNRLRLADFGIAKVSQRTIKGSGSGSVGFMAPEQAMGRPSLKSDVFSLGLIICRMLSGQWPQWPFSWPPPGYQQLKRKTHPDLIDFLHRAIEPNPRKRFRDAEHMLNAFRRVRPRALRYAERRKRRKPSGA